MRSVTSLVVLVVVALSSTVLAAPGVLEARVPAPAPSKRFEARAPLPSKRFEARAPAPSKRAPAPAPSKRAPAPAPSKRAPAPAPSKRAPAPAPQPSKRSLVDQIALYGEQMKNDLAKQLCPGTSRACPAESVSRMPETLVEWSEIDFECMNFEEDLRACGGCGSVDVSYDCTAIPNALAVACVSGACQVHTCKEGFTSSPFSPSTCIQL